MHVVQERRAEEGFFPVGADAVAAAHRALQSATAGVRSAGGIGARAVVAGLAHVAQRPVIAVEDAALDAAVVDDDVLEHQQEEGHGAEQEELLLSLVDDQHQRRLPVHQVLDPVHAVLDADGEHRVDEEEQRDVP